MANSLFSKVVKSLWILAAFIPFLNGLGFAYIGAKEFKREWVREGLIYEIPWFLAFLFINNEGLCGLFIIIGFLMLIVGIVRTFIVYRNNKDILIDDDPESQIIVEKSFSSFWIIFSFIIFINGFGLVLVGFKRNVKQWIIEGLIFEFLWVLVIAFNGASTNVSYLLISIAMIGWILSIIRTFMVYFEEEKMDMVPFNANQAATGNGPSSLNHVDSSQLSNSASSGKETLIPELKEYKSQIIELKDNFKSKENDINNLLNKRFRKEELSYGRFKSVVNECHDVFYSQADSALNIINLAPNYSERIDSTIKDKIALLKSLIVEMDNLIEELILNDGLPDKSDEDIDHLFSNMHDLINSVDDYN